MATFRLTFTRAGQPFRLVGDNGEEGRVTVNDDLTGLTNMYVVAQGFYE